MGTVVGVLVMATVMPTVQLVGVLAMMLRVQLAVGRRSGWTWKRDARDARKRHPRLPDGHASRATWRWLMAGQLAGGARAEVFRIHSERKTRRFFVKRHDTTTAAVVFPFELPSASLSYDPDAVALAQPGWDRLHGHADDPRAAVALFTADVLEAARAGRYAWRMEGDTVVLTTPKACSPRRMLELVDYVPTLVRRLPD